jgi:hypothetical protein
MQSLGSIRKAKNISTITGKVYKTFVLNILLYNSEMWMLKETTKTNLKVFLMKNGGMGQTWSRLAD